MWGCFPMRLLILLASTTLLAACGGAGPESAGSIAPIGSGSGGGGTGQSGNPHSFVDPSDVKTYSGIGASQHLTLDEGGEFYKDRKSTRLNSSHVRISYAVFC